MNTSFAMVNNGSIELAMILQHLKINYSQNTSTMFYRSLVVKTSLDKIQFLLDLIEIYKNHKSVI